MKFKKNNWQIHHIVPRSRNGIVTKLVPPDYHSAYHKLFENLTPSEIQQYLNQIWFNKETQFKRPLEWLDSVSE